MPRSMPPSPSRSRRARSGFTSPRGGFTPVRSSSPTSGSAPVAPPPGARLRRCSGGCRSAPPATRSSRAGSVLVVGGAPGTTGAPVLTRDGGAARRCRLRHARRPARVPGGRRGARARARQARLRLGGRGGAIVAEAERADAVAIGPGLGRSAEAHALVARLLERLELPVVVDADALFGLQPLARSHRRCSRRTPASSRACSTATRPGSTPTGSRRREGCRALRRRRAAQGGGLDRPGARRRPVVCDTGPPSLATAGTGDVLTGVVAAFLAKGLDPVTAAAAAATAHGLAPRPSRTRPGSSRATWSLELPSVLSSHAVLALSGHACRCRLPRACPGQWDILVRSLDTGSDVGVGAVGLVEAGSILPELVLSAPS